MTHQPYPPYPGASSTSDYPPYPGPPLAGSNEPTEETSKVRKRFSWMKGREGRPTESSASRKPRTGESDELWEPLKPSRAQRTFQAVVAVGVVGLLGANLWSLTHPAPVVQEAQSVAIPETLGVDVAGASAVAEAAAWAFMNLDDPGAREARLDALWATPTKSWDGKGSLTANPSVHTVKTTVRDAEHVDVLVAVPVSSDAGDAVVGVLVPITVEGQGAGVAGAPSIVGLPAPVASVPTAIPETDVQLTSNTKSDIDAFFTAWAEGDAIAVSAPGAVIPAPPAGLGTLKVDSWRAFVGDGSTRSGLAHVTWSIGGAQLVSTYTLTLTQVSGGDASRWQVSSLSY